MTRFYSAGRYTLFTPAMTSLITILTTGLSDPTGASHFFTTDDTVIREARGLVNDGALKEAEAVLGQVIESGSQASRDSAAEGLEIIRRIRLDYRLDAEAMLAKLQKQIPDISADDLERWRIEGTIQYRMLDGEFRYFGREPSNLFRFCPEAIRRRDAARKEPVNEYMSPSRTQRLAHIAEALATARRTGELLVLPLQHEITYRMTVVPDRAGGKAGSHIRCWLPYPQPYRQQGDVRLLHASPGEVVLAPAAVDADPVTGDFQRTIYLEHRVEDPAEMVRFEARFTYVSHAYVPRIDETQATPIDRERMRPYLQERPPHIVFTPELRKLVDEIVGKEANPLKRTRAIFRYIDAHIRYCAEMEYATIPSFTEKALSSRRGDCGVQTMLFITMCRAAGVPARWQSGWVTQPDAWNMHDWAEIHVEPWGWLPVDVSYGLQESDDPAIREFYFGHLDAYRMIVNLDYGSPLHPPKADLRSEPADFQRGEIEMDGRNLYFDQWDWHFEVRVTPLTPASHE